MHIVIRPEQAEDIAQIDQVNKLAFGGEFESRLVAKLRQGSSFIPALSLVALLNEQV